MLLVVDLDSNQVIWSPGNRQAVSSVAFKHGVSTTVDVQFVRAGVVQELDPAPATAATGKFGLKSPGQYDADFIVSSVAWTKTGTGTSTVYTFAPDFNSTALRAKLFIDGNPANDVGSTTLMGEIEWVDSTSRTFKTATFNAVVANDIIRGTEGATATGNPGYWNKAEADARFLRMDSGLYGKIALAAGVANKAVAGLTLPFTPDTVLAWVTQAGGVMAPIFGTVDDDTLSPNGFTVYFDGLPPDTAHVLHWIAFPPPADYTTVDETEAAAQTVVCTTAAATIDLSKPGLTVLDLTDATGAVALTLNNPIPGRFYAIEVVQGATPREVALPANTKQKGGGGNAYTASGANARDLIRLTYDGTNYLIEVSQGYA